MTRTAEAIVGGGGIIGASILFQLGALGVRRAILCEAAQPGAGASGASGAFIQLHFCRNEPETALTLASLPYFQRWSELVGAGDPGFVPSGYLRLEPIERAAILHERVALLQGFGGGTSVISPSRRSHASPPTCTPQGSPRRPTSRGRATQTRRRPWPGSSPQRRRTAARYSATRR